VPEPADRFAAKKMSKTPFAQIQLPLIGTRPSKLGELVHEVNAETIFRGVSMLSKTFQKWETEKAGRQPFNPGQLAVFIEAATEMAAALKQAELLISHKHAEGLVGALKKTTPLSNGNVALEGMPLQFAYHHLQRLLSAIEDEAGLRLFVSVQSNAANLYAPEKPAFEMMLLRSFHQ
jgi:hypothetical protein